jgi:hypothetical protein
MKTVFICMLSLFWILNAALAQETPYQKIMKKEIKKLTSLDSSSHLQQSANAFARISEMNTGEWQPLYYEALAHIYQSFNSTLSLDQKDAQTDKALSLLSKADALSSSNSEIVALQGFATMAKLTADPASRGQTLSAQAIGLFQKALGLDQQNPRAMVLLAQMEWGMSQFFGSGNEKPCKLATQSLSLFESQDEDARKVSILPTWGQNMAHELLRNCK